MIDVGNSAGKSLIGLIIWKLLVGDGVSSLRHIFRDFYKYYEC